MQQLTAAERSALARACDLAALGAGTALPNPVVGCVLLDPSGEVVGEGFHERAGGPHAEVVALSAAGERARGATAVVTLEPCNHTGRTGPCSEALIAAGVARVVVAVRDPWPTAAGGIDRLRAAGLDVLDLADEFMTPFASAGFPPDGRAALGSAAGAGAEIGALVARARDVNRVWLGAVSAGRPFVTLKIAMSLDGRVAAPDGTSRWISSAESRAHAHRMRGQIDAIMVGVGTVLADDPALTARDESGGPMARQPLRIVADTDGRTPTDAKVRGDGLLIATAAQFGRDSAGRVDLGNLVTHLTDRGVIHLLVEGGPRLAASVLDAGLVDEVLIYLAPVLLGAGRSAVEGGSLTTLAEARRAELRESTPIGPDMMLRYALVGGALRERGGAPARTGEETAILGPRVAPR